MLDLLTIFSKGGIVLWCFQGTCQSFSLPVNELIRSVILQERGGTNSFNHGSLTLKYKLDNEFELVFVVAFQKILQLSYIDKLLDTIHLEFRDKYKNDLENGVMSNFLFDETFSKLLREIEFSTKVEAQVPKKMRTFGESKKSQKTVASMITFSSTKNEKPTKRQEKEVPTKPMTAGKENTPVVTNGTCNKGPVIEESREEILRKNREKMMKKMAGKSASKPIANGKASPKASKEKKKEARKWENGGNVKDMKDLDFSSPSSKNGTEVTGSVDTAMKSMVGSMQGDLKDLEYESDEEMEEIEEEEEDRPASNKKSDSSSGGMFSFFKGLAGQKTITREDVEPILEKLQVHLISKNVASDISEQLCESVSTKLEGKVLGTFSGVASTVKASMEESLIQILSPKRRVDILRDAMEAQNRGRPFTITFCGVNGVGKSTNLAKICFWLLENNFRVLIAACDTFRAGAVEQLRTHVRHLNSLHPPKISGGPDLVTLYEKGYGKDAASIAMDAINFAREQRIDVVLVDTAGRMQDNEPLMRSLAKLIKLNNPELVLFVGEALVGNEAVDQLQKFNQALADYSNQDNPRLIDGIVLTKFDTIDDKVGAAISMTYTTGKPIVFVGTGQTYKDLRNLNVKAVVHSLLRA